MHASAEGREDMGNDSVLERERSLDFGVALLILVLKGIGRTKSSSSFTLESQQTLLIMEVSAVSKLG